MAWVFTKPRLWTLDSGLDSELNHGLTAIQALINGFHYNNYYCLADLHSFLIQDVPNLNNNIYNKCLIKSFHGADADDDLDRFI